MAPATIDKGKGRAQRQQVKQRTSFVESSSTGPSHRKVEYVFLVQDIRARPARTYLDPTGFWKPSQSATLFDSWFNDQWWHYDGTCIRKATLDNRFTLGKGCVHTLHHFQSRFHLTCETVHPLRGPGGRVAAPELQEGDAAESGDYGLKALYMEDLEVENAARRHIFLSCGGGPGGQTGLISLLPPEDVLKRLIPKALRPMPNTPSQPLEAGLCGNVGVMLALIFHSVHPDHIQDVLTNLVQAHADGHGTYWSLNGLDKNFFRHWVNKRGVVVTVYPCNGTTTDHLKLYEESPRNFFPVPSPAPKEDRNMDIDEA